MSGVLFDLLVLPVLFVGGFLVGRTAAWVRWLDDDDMEGRRR